MDWFGDRIRSKSSFVISGKGMSESASERWMSPPARVVERVFVGQHIGQGETVVAVYPHWVGVLNKDGEYRCVTLGELVQRGLEPTDRFGLLPSAYARQDLKSSVEAAWDATDESVRVKDSGFMSIIRSKLKEAV